MDNKRKSLIQIFNEKYGRNDVLKRLLTMFPGDNFRLFGKDYTYKSKKGASVVAINKRSQEEEMFPLSTEVVFEPVKKESIKKVTKKKTTNKKVEKKKATKKTTKKKKKDDTDK